jgi:hypothetical protein
VLIVKSESPKDIAKIFDDGTLIDAAMRNAVREALSMHKKLGFPVVEWRDGRIVWIQARDIKLAGGNTRQRRRAPVRKRSK